MSARRSDQRLPVSDSEDGEHVRLLLVCFIHGVKSSHLRSRRRPGAFDGSMRPFTCFAITKRCSVGQMKGDAEKVEEETWEERCIKMAAGGRSR